MPKQSRNFASNESRNDKDSNNQRKKFQKKPATDSFFRISADDNSNQLSEQKEKFNRSHDRKPSERFSKHQQQRPFTANANPKQTFTKNSTITSNKPFPTEASHYGKTNAASSTTRHASPHSQRPHAYSNTNANANSIANANFNSNSYADSNSNAMTTSTQRFDPYAKARHQFEAKVQQQAEERADRERQREEARTRQVQKYQKAKVRVLLSLFVAIMIVVLLVLVVLLLFVLN
jgi:cobalamin biosynthesis Mg chelatase CobN